MKKRSVAAVLAAVMFVFCFAFVGCDNKEQSDNMPDPAVTQNTQTFITIVSKIETPVTVEAGGKIASAILVYDALSDVEKTNEEVIASKTKLDGYKTDYDAAKAAADAAAEVNREQKNIAYFVKTVGALPDLGSYILAHRADVDAAYALYESLKAESKSDVSVVGAYAKLEAANAEIAELERKEHERKVKEEAEKFIADVAEMKETLAEAEGEFSEAIETAIDNLLDRYETFEDDVKAYEDADGEASVAAAKAELDGIAADCKTWRDDKDAADFIEQAAALVIDNISLESDGAIGKAESLYKYMSDEAKAQEGVAEAWETVQAAREKYEQLYAADQAVKVAAFIEAANAVGTDTENVDISWYDVLNNASIAYKALSYDSTRLPEVQEAFARWDAAQVVFNKKGYKQIPMVNPNLEFSGDNPPFLVMNGVDNMINKLYEFYKVDSLAALDGKVKVWLNVYIDGEYVDRGEMSVTVLTRIVHSDVIKSVMREIASRNDRVVSGTAYGFALNFEDKANEFIPSGTTNIVFNANKPYTW